MRTRPSKGSVGVSLMVALVSACGVATPVPGGCTLGVVDVEGRTLVAPYAVLLVEDHHSGAHVAHVGLTGSGWTGTITVEVVGPNGEAEDPSQYPQFTDEDTPGIGLLDEGQHHVTVRDEAGCRGTFSIETRGPED